MLPIHYRSVQAFVNSLTLAIQDEIALRMLERGERRRAWGAEGLGVLGEAAGFGTCFYCSSAAHIVGPLEPTGPDQLDTPRVTCSCI